MVRDIGIRVMNELVQPFKAIQMDDTEFACLKAIVFFDPNARGLGDINRIKGLRYLDSFHKIGNIFCQMQVPNTDEFRGLHL